MLPAGKITDDTIGRLADLLHPGDTIIDGGNTFYKDDIRRAKALSARSINYVDVGTSGGLWGLERGYCLMVGASPESFAQLEPVFKALAPGLGTIDRTLAAAPCSPEEEGYLHCGPVGSGHFVKMVHNGIEYGLMQAYAEGFDIIKNADKLELEGQAFDLNPQKIAELWRRGSVVSSWLLDLSAKALAQDPKLEGFGGRVQDSGEGRWTVETAVEEGVPANVLSASLFARFRSRQQSTFADKILSAMRFQFGGHKE
jgi:6-phosphogluconate dehydrogenase